MAANLTDRRKLIALAKMLSKTEVVEFEDGGDNGAWIWVLCPFRPGTTWVAIRVLWHTECQCTNHAAGRTEWVASFEDVIQFLHVALSAHINETVREAA